MSDEELDPREALLKNHRKEKKDLQAKIQALKKTASKGDKKKKKDINDEISKLESDLVEKQKLELLQLETSSLSLKEAEVTNGDDRNSDAAECDDNEHEKEPRVSKAQKRRDKKAEKDKQRLLDIERQEEENKNGIRHLEQEKIKSLLEKRSLKLAEIPSDGDCMFAGLVHQLAGLGNVSTVADLRKSTAKELMENKADYSPFLSNPRQVYTMFNLEVSNPDFPTSVLEKCCLMKNSKLTVTRWPPRLRGEVRWSFRPWPPYFRGP